jgi:tyrosine--tRNA ligase
MFFRVDKKIANVQNGIYTGVVVAYGLNNRDSCTQTTTLLQSVVDETVNNIREQDIKTFDSLNNYREAMKSLGINPSKFPCSIEAILTRISKKGEFPSISPVVDLGNYISIKYNVPVGVHDIDSLDDDLCVRLATLEDCKDEDNQYNSDKLVEGEPVYAVGNSVRTRRWLWRQMPAGRVTENSTNFVFPIDGFFDNKESIDAACDELVLLIHEIFNVEAESGKITSEELEFRFGSLTDEEKAIENQIAIMLKGVAQYTAVSEIRQKLTDAVKENRALRIKLGLDPSAPDIHLGHSVVLRKIRQMQDLGHVAVIIIGDFTGMIGDPTGKSATRKQLTRAQVEENANTYMEQIFKIIDKDKTEVYYNSEWLGKMSFADVIELASKCTVARMLERDDFNNRYTNHQPLSVHEFFYPLMQAYDSVAIRADIELGGTDQTFNILMGRNIQRDYGQDPQLTLFMPLLEGIDGKDKMSKSLGNYIGISENPAVIFEKVMKIPDALIIKYFNLCTDLHPEKVNELQRELEAGANPRDIKMILAREITSLYAGTEAADEAELRFKSVFQQNQIPDDAPVVLVDSCDGAADGNQLATALVRDGYYTSKSHIRRIFQQGGAAWDNERITDINALVITNEEHILKLGKSNFFRVRI